jgi:hypothetical protein
MDTTAFSPGSYVISIRVDRTANGLAVWRGVLVTAAGQRLPFSTLAQLNSWLCELTGWQEPSQDGEAGPPR